MQLLSTSTAYYIKSVRSILKICRKTSKVSIVQHTELAELDDWHILSNAINGYIGKLVIDEYSFFLVILSDEQIGLMNDEPVYKINNVLAVPILDDGIERPTYFDTLKNGFDKIKDKQQRLFSFITNRGLSSVRLAEDVTKLINELQTFYYCKNLDLTLSTQQRAIDASKSIDEFFWNRNLLEDLLLSDGSVRENANEWIIRVIHGYFDQRQLTYDDTSQLRLTLVSRRSVHRAGVRYLRRGVDKDGFAANFVETEMIISFYEHQLSFVQIRASIPVFWKQTGYKYRPVPVIDKPMEESLPVFKEHFKRLEQVYGSPIVVINLVDTSGREAALGEAFKQHILELGMDEVLYFPFDFHASSKDNGTQLLLDSMQKDLQKIGFCWIDKTGQLVRRQTGIIRTNCVDCLDRTNVVQSAISQSIVAVQALKLGLIEPFAETPEVLIQLLSSIWTSHGDCLSRQYSGTDALRKNEKTARHRQKLIGLLKNGVNSAKRYKNAHIHDYSRQRAIDILISGKGSTTLKPNEEAELNSQLSPEGSTTDEDEEVEDESNTDDIAGTSHKVNQSAL